MEGHDTSPVGVHAARLRVPQVELVRFLGSLRLASSALRMHHSPGRGACHGWEMGAGQPLARGDCAELATAALVPRTRPVQKLSTTRITYHFLVICSRQTSVPSPTSSRTSTLFFLSQPFRDQLLFYFDL
ncbi:hypothetical protein CKAH01_06785 [Colletotrichum kahawae]|uniref:Uncharacterized protein n=1 Tax=Colletotrichum kahawae TaxID=34407 RepID=A0AAD9Y8H2_COLKA|nr:hypothetical protein CKAH01_06785 [Colletotrichum kahawae]